MGQIKNYFTLPPKQFYYNIAGFNFTLEEIKHGLLRNNLRAPMNYMKSMNANDNRLKILQNYFDPRINFICLDFPNFLEHIDSFDGNTEESLEEGLESFVSEMINAKVNIDMDNGEIILPKVLAEYRSDFAGSED